MLVETVPKSWVSEHGRVVLIGDAAHATLPWLGQVSITSRIWCQISSVLTIYREAVWLSKMHQFLQDVYSKRILMVFQQLSMYLKAFDSRVVRDFKSGLHGRADEQHF